MIMKIQLIVVIIAAIINLFNAGCANMDTTSRPSNILSSPNCTNISIKKLGYIDRGTGLAHFTDITVHSGEKSEPIKIDAICFDTTGNGKTISISVNEIEKIPTGIAGLIYGISTDNKLLLIMKEKTGLQVITNKEGNYNSLEFELDSKYMTAAHLLESGNFLLTQGETTKDGRINVNKIQGGKIAKPKK